MSGGSSPVLLVQAIVAPASLQDEIDRTAYAMAHLFDGSPPWCQPIFAIALALILVSVLSTLILGNRSRSEGRRERDDDRDLPELDESDFLWVFVVPALNEEVTIADSVGRLAEVEVRNRVILVIDDGSDDRTGEILAGLDLPELT
ncbi:hypothetical protein BMH30_06375, partial [Leucobacter sp. OLES1]